MTDATRSRPVIAMLTVIAAACLGVWASGGKVQLVEVQGLSIQSNRVVADLYNPDSEPRVVTMTVQVTLNSGASESGSSSVFVDGKSSSSLAIPFSGPVGEIDQLSMNDDAQPF